MCTQNFYFMDHVTLIDFYIFTLWHVVIISLSIFNLKANSKSEYLNKYIWKKYKHPLVIFLFIHACHLNGMDHPESTSSGVGRSSHTSPQWWWCSYCGQHLWGNVWPVECKLYEANPCHEPIPKRCAANAHVMRQFLLAWGNSYKEVRQSIPCYRRESVRSYVQGPRGCAW